MLQTVNKIIAAGQMIRKMDDFHFHELSFGQFGIRLESNFIHKIGTILWEIKS